MAGICLVAGLLCGGGLPGQNWLFNRQAIQPEDGLASRLITAICQDSCGFIWLSTSEGIQRYDGYSFKLYRSETHNLYANQARTILADRRGLIWAFFYNDVLENATFLWRTSQINLLDPVTDQVHTFDDYFSGKKPFLATDVSGVNVDERGRFLIATRKGEVYRYDGSFRRLLSGLSPVSLVRPAGPTTFWVVHRRELRHVNLKGDVLSRDSLPFSPRFLTPVGSRGILLGQPFYGRYDNPKRPKLLYKTHGRPWSQSLSVGRRVIDLRPLIQVRTDAHGRLWALGNNVLHVFTSEGDPILTIPAHGDSDWISWPLVFSDRNGLMWIHQGKNLMIWEVTPSPFRSLLRDDGYSVRGMLPMENGRLLVNTYGGTKLLDRTGQAVRDIEPSDFFGLGLFRDAAGGIWTGMHSRGAGYFADTSISYERFTLVLPGPAVSGDVFVIRQDARGVIWLGTSWGMAFREPGRPEINLLSCDELKNTTVQWIEPGGEEWLLGTDRGLFRFDPFTRQVLKVEEAPAADIYHIYRRRAGDIWLATRGLGLIRWDRSRRVFERFGVEQGFSSNIIYAVYEDGNGKLWLPSQNGLMAFDPVSGQITTFFERNGLPDNEFNYLAHCRLPDSTLVFGGVNGLVFFHPDSLNAGLLSPQGVLTITGVSMLNHHTGMPEDRTQVFAQSSELRVEPWHHYVTIQLSMLDFLQPRKNIFAYRIRGLEEHWHYLRDNTVHLGQMPYGRYVLEIKGQGANGQWNASQLAIPIHVITPFYRTTLFQVLIGFFLVAVGVAIAYWQVHRLRRDKRRLDREVARRTAQIEHDKQIILRQLDELERLYRMKDRLFTIIGHELRGPVISLHGIADKVAYLMEMGDVERARAIGGIADETTRQMRLLIDNLLNWGRAERGRLLYHPETFDPAPVVAEAVDFHRLAIEAKDISCRLEIPPGLTLFMDRNALRVIALNLIGNAVKFTPAGGCIRIRGRVADAATVALEFADTGLGLDTGSMHDLFDGRLKSRPGTNNEKGVGIGLMVSHELVRLNRGEISVDSTPGQGATFTLWLPAREEAVVS